ncbi:MAG: hypothetical protein ABI542_09355 [Gemmatimonadota bacterium]
MRSTTRSVTSRARLTAFARRSVIVVGMALAVPATAHAHDEGILKLVSRTLVAGDSVTVMGTKFSKRSSLRLVVVGLGGRFELTEATTDSVGSFTLRVLIPADAPIGAYRLVAFADDGDEAAALDVALTANSASADSVEQAPATEPTDQPLALERATSTLVTWGAVGLVLIALGLGTNLLRERTLPE